MKRLMLLLGVFLLGAPVLWAQSETPTKKVAILEVVDRDNAINYGVKLLLRTTLAKAITQTQGYEGYDRVDMGAILGEHDFQRTGMVSDEQIKRFGEMTGVAYVLVAEAARLDANTILVTAKLLDVETAKLERTDYEQMGMSAKEMADGCRKVAQRLFASSVGDMTGDNATRERRTKGEAAVWQMRESTEKVTKDTEGTTELDLNSKVIRKGANLFMEDRYGVQTKMSNVQAWDYLGTYSKSWQAAKNLRIVGISLFAAGGAISLVTSPFNYIISSFGGAIMLAGIPTWIVANKKMNRILQAANEQHGIPPYRTAASLHIGDQPHGVGLGIRF